MQPDEPPRGAILFVDDEQELASAIGTMLTVSLAGEDVWTACDAREALSRVLSERPAVLITDARMPDVSGMELILAVQERWGPTPCILTTALPDQHGFESMGSDYLQYLPKPFPFFSLLEMIRKVRAAPLLPARSLGMLGNLLQMLAISGASGMLAISSSGHHGEIHFLLGRVVSCQAGEETGRTACRAVLSWAEGDLSWQKVLPTIVGDEIDLAEVLQSVPLLGAKKSRKMPRSIPVGAVALPERLERIDGFLGAALVEINHRAVLGVLGGHSFDLHEAAAGNCELVLAKRRVLASLGVRDEIEDILISLGHQYHLIRPLRSRPSAFLYLVLDRQQANLALARLHLAGVEEELGS